MSVLSSLLSSTCIVLQSEDCLLNLPDYGFFRCAILVCRVLSHLRERCPHCQSFAEKYKCSVVYSWFVRHFSSLCCLGSLVSSRSSRRSKQQQAPSDSSTTVQSSLWQGVPHYVELPYVSGQFLRNPCGSSLLLTCLPASGWTVSLRIRFPFFFFLQTPTRKNIFLYGAGESQEVQQTRVTRQVCFGRRNSLHRPRGHHGRP